MYISQRANRCSGNAILKNAAGDELLASEYIFGLGKDPKIRVLSSEASAEKDSLITIKGRWMNRAQEFALPDGKSFTWRYIKGVDPTIKPSAFTCSKRSFLILEVPEFVPSSPISNQKFAENQKRSRRRVAELVRNDETRTPGTTYQDSGNGGELQIDSAYCEGFGLREDVIVASCIMMLKKEIDRRRAMAGAA
jgi:hypothetical protein